jgi:phage/plasmid-associated DNA primase
MCVILDRFNKEISYTTRELLPNDYTTITTGYPLLEEHFLDKEYKDYCKSIITNQFQDPETAESYLTIIGMSLYGELLEKKFFINKGYGDNGRSFFANLIHLVFGDYHGTFNSDFFLSKDKQDNDIKSPEAIDNRYKRFITLNEPTASNGFNATTWAIEKIKMFSGNDIIQCRKLQTNTITNYINRSTLMNSLNRVIKFSFIDSAILERVKVIPQDTQFVDEITLPHHCLKIKDTAFLKTDRFKNCMMAVFIEYWEIYVNKGLVFSKQIEDTTAELLTDKTTDFLNKYYTRTTDTKDFVLLGDIYNLYLRKVSQGKYSIKRPAFKELIISKRHVIKKIDKIINKERINKEAIVFLKRNEEVFDNDEDNTEYEL